MAVAGEEVCCEVEGEAAAGSAFEVAAAGVFGNLAALVALWSLLLEVIVDFGVEFCCCCCCCCCSAGLLAAGLLAAGVGIIFPS